MVCYDMQQLYLFGGLLLIFAIINVQPLSVVGRLSELGALFNLVGETAVYAFLLQSLPMSRPTCLCPCPCPSLLACRFLSDMCCTLMHELYHSCLLV